MKARVSALNAAHQGKHIFHLLERLRHYLLILHFGKFRFKVFHGQSDAFRAILTFYAVSFPYNSSKQS